MPDYAPRRVLDTGVAERMEELVRRHELVKDKRMLSVEKPARIIRRANSVSEGGVTDVPTAERVLGAANETVHAHFLERGARAARTVGLVVRVSADGRARALGTGSMISATLLITNHHVLEDARSAARCAVDFDVEYDLSGSLRSPVRFRTDPGTFFASEPSLDIAVVAMAPRDGGGPPGVEYGANVLSDGEDAFVLGEFLNVVQHPRGGLKQVSFRENRLLDHTDEQCLWYETDTDPGSSGSPVFNDQWTLVAIHRASVPRTDAQQRALDKDGVIVMPDTPDERIDWIANEGVRIAAVRAWLQELDLSGTAAELRDECLAG